MHASQQDKVTEASPAGALATRKLAESIGVEILGVDLREDLSDSTVEAIRHAWHRNCVILLRGQTLDEAAQVKFAQRLGELGKVLHTHNGRSSLPGVMYISNIRENGKLIGALPDGEMFFHSDQCYIENPSVGTMLYAMEVPSKGGDTIFANMFAAYDALPDELKQIIEGRTALNVYDYENAATVRGSEPKEGVPSWVHPMVKVHPATGRKALYFNRLMTHHIVGMDRDQSESLLARLFDHQEQDRFIYRHVWKPGDLVLWDNRSTLHARSDFDASERRLMRRTVVVREH
ncbi:MAG: TauD/TfdA dioxygenase family protein [Beijerinckiaceae bacterium]